MDPFKIIFENFALNRILLERMNVFYSQNIRLNFKLNVNMNCLKTTDKLMRSQFYCRRRAENRKHSDKLKEYGSKSK